VTFVPPVIAAIPTEFIFPDNVVDLTATWLATAIPQNQGVYKRPLRVGDPNYSLGVYALSWVPDELEIGSTEPTFTTYTFGIETLAKYGDEQLGREWGAYLAKSVRLMVYRNQGFTVPLRQMSETRPSDGSMERVQRFGIRKQMFSTGNLQQQSLHFSKTEFWVQTESM
jgi:hypothetical protein